MPWTATAQDGSAYERNVFGIDGSLAAIVVDGSTTLQLANLHGDIVATATMDSNASGPAETFESDEFGVPRSPAAGRRYGWLGAKLRHTELGGSGIAMGARLYLPRLGRFAQVDPVADGSANAYDYANQDPQSQLDLDGTKPKGIQCFTNSNDANPYWAGDHVSATVSVWCRDGTYLTVRAIQAIMRLELFDKHSGVWKLKDRRVGLTKPRYLMRTLRTFNCISGLYRTRYRFRGS